MKNSHRWAILAVVVSLGYLISLAVAQNPMGGAPGQPTAGPRLALIDVTRIVKNHERFKQQMAEMKRDVQAAEDKIQKERDDIKRQATEVLPALNKGSQQYQTLEEQLANRQAQLAVEMNRMKNDFLQREATIYYNVYQEILQATGYFCKQNRIDMVLRFNGDPVDVQHPDSVLAFITKPVVWYDPGLDITDVILQDVNRPVVNPRGADERGAPTRPVMPFGERR